MDTVRVGLIGSGFITSIHYESLQRVNGVRVVAVASATPGHAERFAAERGIARPFHRLSVVARPRRGRPRRAGDPQ